MLNSHFKMYANGLMLILISWGLKHVLVSAAIFGGGQAVEEQSLNMAMQAEIWDETIDDQIKIAELEAELAEATGDTDAKRKKIGELREEIGKEAKKIREKYIAKRVEAEYGSVKGASKSLALTKWTLKLKILLDFAKIAGVFMIVIASIRMIRTEPSEDDVAVGPTRNLAIASIVLVLFGTFVQGVISYLS